MRRYSILITLTLAFCACDSNDTISIQYPDGGYDYPEKIVSKDSAFLYYPIKDLISTNDSFIIEYYGDHFYHLFDETNLSLKPQENPVFRFDYFDGALSNLKPIVILLTEKEIVVKQGIKGHLDPLHDTAKLNELEKNDFAFLELRFPLNDTKYNTSQRRYLDSIVKQNPKLLDAGYYRYLLDKSAYFIEEFTYKTERISISNQTYKHLVNQINESGYWKMPFDLPCPAIPSDAGGFALEVNTPKKYNIVRSATCPYDTSKFIKACQELVKYSKLDDKIQLVWAMDSSSSSIPMIKEVELEDIKQ